MCFHTHTHTHSLTHSLTSQLQEAFESALEPLSVSQLYAECHRLLNSIYHLRRSNATLLTEDFASDPDCREAVLENEEVIARQQRRVEMVQAEMKRRGFRSTHGEGRELGLGERRRLSGTEEMGGIIDGANHLLDSGGRARTGGVQTGEVESRRLGSGGVESSDTFVENVSVQDNFIAVGTNEMGYMTPVAEGVQGDRREQRTASMPSTPAQTNDVNGVYL